MKVRKRRENFIFFSVMIILTFALSFSRSKHFCCSIYSEGKLSLPVAWSTSTLVSLQWCEFSAESLFNCLRIKLEKLSKLFIDCRRRNNIHSHPHSVRRCSEDISGGMHFLFCVVYLSIGKIKHNRRSLRKFNERKKVYYYFRSFTKFAHSSLETFPPSSTLQASSTTEIFNDGIFSVLAAGQPSQEPISEFIA